MVFGEVLEGYDEASPLFCLVVDSGWWIVDAGRQEDGSSSKSQKAHFDTLTSQGNFFSNTP